MDRGILQEQAGGLYLPVIVSQEGLLNKGRQPLILLRKMVLAASSQVMWQELLCLLLGVSYQPFTSLQTCAEPAGPGPGSSGRTLAGAAVGFGAALFLFTRLAGGGPSWAAFERAATPIDIALSNGKPTVVELYATWCEVCRELLPDTYAVRSSATDRLCMATELSTARDEHCLCSRLTDCCSAQRLPSSSAAV